jgi:hypothetical protein
MNGVVFYGSERHDEVVSFYRERTDATVWHEQIDCTVFEHGGFRFGFCDRSHTDDCGYLTLTYPDRAGVDAAYEALADVADDEPTHSAEYEIYRFLATDPDGRNLEIQTFEHDG